MKKEHVSVEVCTEKQHDWLSTLYILDKQKDREWEWIILSFHGSQFLIAYIANLVYYWTRKKEQASIEVCTEKQHDLLSTLYILDKQKNRELEWIILSFHGSHCIHSQFSVLLN